jgi:phytanoyl-CoA hydroxylase
MPIDPHRYAVPGSHLKPLRKKYVRLSESECGWESAEEGREVTEILKDQESEYEDSAWVALPAKRGSLVMLHGNLLHRSYANTSASQRHAYTLHCVDGILPWSDKNWLQNQRLKNRFPILATSKK